MRVWKRRQRTMLVVIDSEKLVAKDHPLTQIKQLAEESLGQLSPVSDKMYSAVGTAVD